MSLINSITVVDDGRGIPVDIQEKRVVQPWKQSSQCCMLEVNLVEAAIKFLVDCTVIGSSVVNALSTVLDVTVHKDGQKYYQEYHRGLVGDDLKIIGETDRRGTTVHFVPDPEIFTETVEFDFDKLATRVRELAFLNRGLRISLTDKREGNEKMKFTSIMKVEFSLMLNI